MDPKPIQLFYIDDESKALQHLPVIIYATSTHPKTATECRQLGASMYLVKPNSLVSLRKAIKKITQKDWDSHTPNDTNFLYIVR